jgi:hypothetical protein
MRRLLIAVPALALLAGCGLLYAEVEIPSTTITLKQQVFDATTPGAPLVKDITFDVGSQLPLINDKNVTFELRLTQMLVAMTTSSPLIDFGGIESVTLSVLPPAGQTLPEETILASYAKAPPPADQNPKSISVSGMANLDLSPYIASGSMTLRLKALPVTLGAAIPAWTADVGAEFYLKVRADYGNLLTKK